MVRVYSQPGRGGDTSLGGIFGSPKQSRRGVDYNDILEQKRREENSYRSGGHALKSSSDGFLDRVTQPPPPEYVHSGLQSELNDLSLALSRLQGSLEHDGYDDYVVPEADYGYSKSYPNSASFGQESIGRKTWSAPSKDPFAHGDLRQGRREELEDPLQRQKTHSGQSFGGYQPSFGGGNSRGRRGGGGNAAPPISDRGKYMRELEEQMQEQKIRKRKEELDSETDWWEKKPASNEHRTPHPSQEPTFNDKRVHRREEKMSHQGPDPANARKMYEQELKEQMDAKKRMDDEVKRKEREEDEKLEKRLKEQQEKMKKEYDEEMNKKKAKEEAKQKRQEELMRRQVELQKEMDQKKKEEDERRFQEKRKHHRSSSRRPSAVPDNDHQETQYRSSSPPIPTMRSSQVDDQDQKRQDAGEF